MKSYKRILTLILTVVMISAFAVSASAAEVNNELARLKLYIREQVLQPETPEELVAYAKTGLIYAEIESYVPSADVSTVKEAAENLCALIALKGDGADEEINKSIAALTRQLTAMQAEDGTFGDVVTTSKAMVALLAADAEFDADGAAKFIIANQAENGSFLGSAIAVSYDKLYYTLVMENTYWATAALSAYETVVPTVVNGVTDAVKQATVDTAVRCVAKAAEYIKSEIADGSFDAHTAAVISYAILTLTDAGVVAESDECGNLMTALLTFADEEDGAYYTVAEDGAKTLNRQSTVLALRALEAIRYGASDYKALAVNGGFNVGLDLEGLKPILTVFAVIAALSVVMWVLIFTIKKPKTKTLEEFKAEAAAKAPKASEEDLDITKPLKSDDGEEE